MDKKKAGLLIIVLFLIIGLGSFVFANPDNQENLEEGDIEEREDDSDKDSNKEDSSNDLEESSDILTTDSDNQSDDGNYNNVPGTTLDNSNDGTGFTPGPSEDINGEVPVESYDYYADALKAVEQAESSLTQGDVDYATNLVDKVANQSQKDELNNRLEAVQDIIDVRVLIEKLETMVNESKERDDILDSISYRDDEKIETLVNDLTNGTAKDDLVSRLEAINKILNDNEGPVISGIKNNSFTKKDVSLTINDANEVKITVTLNGKEIDYTDTFTEEGTYVVTAEDAAFNVTTLTFTIDRTKPLVGGVEDGKYYNTDVAVTIEDANPNTVHLKKDGELVKPYNAGDPITEEGTYTVVVTDKAGNKSSEITFVIDKHVEDAKWVYILNLSDKNNRKTIRNGQTLRVEVNFDEELTELPVLTIGNSQSTTFRKCGEAEYGKYVCVADLTIDNTIANLEDGEIPFTITNIYDKAGNTITLGNANVTETKEYGQLTYDGTAPVVKSLGVVDKGELSTEAGRLYAKYGDTVRVLVYFEEKLGIEPTVKFANKEYTATYREKSSNPKKNSYAYYADIKLTEEMNLTDGLFTFEVYGYADKIGNVGVNLTESDVNMVSYPSVTIDNTLPVLNFHNGFITSGYTVEAIDDNFAYMTVQYYDGRETETIESNTFTLDKEGDNVRYKIKAYDKAGNVSSNNGDIYLDNAVPSISNSVAINEGEETTLENNGIYQKVTLNITDGSLKKVVLVKEDGTEEVLATYEDNFKNIKLTFEKEYTEEGTYTVKAVDRNNNETITTFTIDKTPATRVYSTLDFDKSGKQYYEINKEKVYYVKNGDSFVFRMQFSEELKTAPTVKVGNMEVPVVLVEKFVINEGKYIYEGTVNITEDAKLSQGRLEIVLSNVIDMAGNESKDEIVLNQTPTSNGRVAVYDVTAPGPTILGITGFFDETEDAHYITYGKKVRVLTYYNEKLETNPIVKIGNKDFETYYTEESSDLENGTYAYYADITITEDLGLSEGEILFTVYGHKDLAGNEGRTYTNKDITYNEKQEYDNRYDKVILDNTKPSITGFTDNFYNNKNEIVYINDENLHEVKINGTKYDHDGKYFEKKLTKEGTYTIVATDKAGNTATKTVTIDKTAPEATKVQIINNSNPNSEYIKNGETVRVRVTFNEKLASSPVLTIGNYTATFENVGDGKGNDLYSADITIANDENELKEGKIAFTITGYTDLAGNPGNKVTEASVETNITYDRTAPEVISLTQEYQAKEDGRIKVTITTSEDVSGDAFHDYAWRKTGDNTYVNYYYNSEEVVINFVDQANNSGSYTFTVDADAPEILSLTQEYQAKEGGRIKVTITTSEEIYGDSVNKNGWRKVGDNTYENYYYRTKDVTINVTDKVGNPLVYIFTVDMDAPEVVVTKSNNDKSTNKNVIVTIIGDEDIIVEDGWEKISDTVYTKEYSENGKYSVVVKDKVGNETTVNFEVKRIDKVAPTAIITKSNNDKSTNQDVVVTLVSNEAIYKPEGWTEVKTNKEHEFTKTYSENGKYSVVIKDKAGNETTINFEVKRIDRVAPEITVVDPNKYYLEAGEEYVDKGYSAYDEVDKDVTNLVKISYQFQAEGSSNWEGVDTLDTTKLGVYKLTYTAYDKAGNTAKGTRVIAIRDTKAPKFIGLEDGGIYNPATIQVDDATLKTITVYSKDSKETIEVENGYVIDKAGSYEITAIDQKNNKTTINVKVDITVPTYTFNEGYVEHNNVYGTLNLKLHDENGIASVVINGTQLPHTGYYVDINDGDAYTFKNGENTVTVTDEAGNTVTYTFIVDKNAPTYGFNGGTIENNGVYGTLNLKLHDENGIASVIINGTQLPHTGYYVDINDGDAYTFKDGENIVIVTDNLGNTETYTFVVDKKAPTYSISDGTIEDNGVYETLNLKLHDENGIASVVINGTQLPHTGYYVDINDGHAYTFKNGENIVVVTDIFGNTETYSFNVAK